MQKNVLHAIVRNDEAEALGDVEPLDDARDLDEVDGFPDRRFPFGFVHA